jgi:hypothetical protein
MMKFPRHRGAYATGAASDTNRFLLHVFSSKNLCSVKGYCQLYHPIYMGCLLWRIVADGWLAPIVLNGNFQEAAIQHQESRACRQFGIEKGWHGRAVAALSRGAATSLYQRTVYT